MKSCFKCNKKILRHNVSMQCLLCKNNYHANCKGLAKEGVQHLDIDKWLCLVCNETLFSFNMLTEDEEFIGVITNTIFDLERLNEILFVPLEISYSNDNNPLEYIDVDQNYYSEFS